MPFTGTMNAQVKRFRIGGCLGQYAAEYLVISHEINGHGGAEGDRTPDLIIANDTLSQLSYCPNDRGGYLAQSGRVVKARAGGT